MRWWGTEVLTRHDRFEAVDIRPSGLVFLFYLDRIPLIHEIKRILRGFRRGGYRIDATINSHIPNLRLVFDPPKRDDGPVLKLEWRDASKFCFAARQISNNKTTPCTP